MGQPAADATLNRGPLRSSVLDGLMTVSDTIPTALEKLLPLFGTALDAVIAMRLDGTVAEWNHAAERIFGWTRAEAAGQLMANLIVPPQHRAAHIAGISRYISTGEARVLNQRLEITAIDRDGREFPVELSITTTEAGSEPLFIGFVRDISERKDSEQLLLRRAREAELLFQVSQFAAESDSADPVLEQTLKAICELTGWPVGHALIASPGDSAELISSDIWVGEQSRTFDKLREVTRSLRFTAGVGLPGLILETGEPAWISDTQSETAFVRKGLGFDAAFGFPLKSSGRILAVLEFFTEAKTPADPALLLTVRTLGEQVGRVIERIWAETARAKAEAQASSLEEGYRRIFEQTSDLIFTATLDQVITDCNPAAAAALGLPRSEVLGRGIADFVSSEELKLTQEMLQQKINEGGTTRYDLRVRNAQGQELFWEMNSGLTYGEGDQPIGVHVVARDITARKKWDHHQRLLVAELNHRVKNTLAIVQSLAHQTLRNGGSPEETIIGFEGRLRALATAHNLLTGRNWEAASIGDVIRSALAPFCTDGQCEVEGPEVTLPPETAVSLSLAVHELATNASKYGALSSESGSVSITWTAADGGFELMWREGGGPPVEPPGRSGFGTKMIKRTLGAEFRAEVELDFANTGLVCRVAGFIPHVPAA